MTNEIEGGCLCGAVHYRAKGKPLVVGHCYCVDCRKTSGTSHGTHVALSEDGFSYTGDIKFYDRPADSGNMVSRGFCPACGSAIFSRNSGMPGMVFVRASSLDDLNTLDPQITVYASRAPKWAQIDDSKPVFAEMMEGGPQAAMNS